MNKIIIILILTLMSQNTFAQSKSVINCEIWQPNSFCDIPDSLITLPRIIKAKSAFVKTIDCEELNKVENLKAVWLTLTTKDGASFMFESNFENISLIKSNAENKIHPYAILWDDSFSSELCYISSDFKTNNYKSKFSFQKKIDLILLFIDAEKGDKIIIDNFIKAEILN